MGEKEDTKPDTTPEMVPASAPAEGAACLPPNLSSASEINLAQPDEAAIAAEKGEEERRKKVPASAPAEGAACLPPNLASASEINLAQAFEKRRKLVQILSSLQYFLDQAQALSADITADDVPSKDVAYQFKKLRQDKQTKNHLDDLEELFNYYDDDSNGSLDIEELGMLLSQMGQHKTPDELDRLFNLLDADQSGTIEFDEFAVVIMANRDAKRNVNPEALADRLWKLFDSNGDGSIECLKLSDTLQSLGQNWNTDDFKAFFRDINKSGSGAIEKDEFVDFIRENLGAPS